MSKLNKMQIMAMAALVAGAVLAPFGAQAQQSGVTRTDLQRHDLQGEDGDVDPVATAEVDPDQGVGRQGGHRDGDDRGRDDDRDRVHEVRQDVAAAARDPGSLGAILA